jgi:maltooligosyltrehalose trehalohydrolase
MVDPQDPAAYQQAILNWAEPRSAGHREILELYRELIRLRAAEPELVDPRLDRIRVDYDEQARWACIQRGRFRVLVNLADRSQRLPLDGSGRCVLATGAAEVSDRQLELAAESAAIFELTDVGSE